MSLTSSFEDFLSHLSLQWHSATQEDVERIARIIYNPVTYHSMLPKPDKDTVQFCDIAFYLHELKIDDRCELLSMQLQKISSIMNLGKWIYCRQTNEVCCISASNLRDPEVQISILYQQSKVGLNILSYEYILLSVYYQSVKSSLSIITRLGLLIRLKQLNYRIGLYNGLSSELSEIVGRWSSVHRYINRIENSKLSQSVPFYKRPQMAYNSGE